MAFYKGTKARIPSEDISCFITNLNTGTVIEFGLLSPDEVSDSNSANFEDISIRGRSSPLKGYDSTGPRSISFSIELAADLCPQGLVQTVRRMQALLYPHQQTVIVQPRCLFVLGDFLNITGVPQSVDVVWKKPYTNGMYRFADVSFSMSEVEEVGRFAKEIEA